jgi:antitoxin CptB
MTDAKPDLTYDPHKEIGLENRQRRLLFRSWHRGIKELDLIFGNFVEANGKDFTDADCLWFERLYEEQDHEILGWVTKGENVPEAFSGPMMERLQKLDFMVLKAK